MFFVVLEDLYGKIWIVVGMVIVFIVNWDWFEEWFGLMGYFFSLINDRMDINKGIDFLMKLLL